MGDVALRQGAVLDDRFMLKKQLGAGGCGAVWLASDADDDQREVVLKILHPHFDRYSLAIKQLAREAELLAQLAHPNIAKPFLFNATGQHTYLAMEHIDGRSLDVEIGAHSKADKYFSNDEVLRMFEDLCSAVSHAHSKTIIHRDLKPQNVMILRRGGTIAVKVLDFGIAKLIEGNAFDATTFGRRLGSMFYMSPEQCKGEPADVRSDVFSLGVILFEVITLRRTWAWDPQGRPLRAFEAPVPADGANALSTVLMRVATGPRPKPSDSRAKLPAKIDDLVARAISIEPDRRYQNVDAFLFELKRALGTIREGEFSTEVVTVRSQNPIKKQPVYVAGDSDTRLDRVLDPSEPPPDSHPEHAARSVKVERTEAFAEAPKRESDRNVWRVGGVQPSDMAATAMMAQVEDPDDSDSADHTVPKLPNFTPSPGTPIANILIDDSSGMTGPTLGVDQVKALRRSESETGPVPRDIPTNPQLENDFEEQAKRPSYRGRIPQDPFITSKTPQLAEDGTDRGSPASEGTVRAGGAAAVVVRNSGADPDASVVVRGVDVPGDAQGTVRGALAPEQSGENARPSWRGRLPVPQPDPVALKTSMDDPNATHLSSVVSEPMASAAGFAEQRAPRNNGRALDPTSPDSGELRVDPKVIAGGAAGGTELLFPVVEPKRLGPESTPDDATPINAAELELVSQRQPQAQDVRARRTDPEAARKDREARDIVEVRPSPMFSGPPSATAPSVELRSAGDVVRAIFLAIHRHRLAMIGVIGMLLAFAVGVALARWAAEEVRRYPTTVPEVKHEAPAVPPPPPVAPAKSAVSPTTRAPEPEPEIAAVGMESLLERLKRNPADRALFAELRDAINEAADELESEKTKVAVKKAVAAAAKSGDVGDLESAMRKLERAQPK